MYPQPPTTNSQQPTATNYTQNPTTIDTITYPMIMSRWVEIVGDMCNNNDGPDGWFWPYLRQRVILVITCSINFHNSLYTEW